MPGSDEVPARIVTCNPGWIVAVLLTIITLHYCHVLATKGHRCPHFHDRCFAENLFKTLTLGSS